MNKLIGASFMVLGIIICLCGSALYGLVVFLTGVWVVHQDHDEDDGMHGGQGEVALF